MEAQLTDPEHSTMRFSGPQDTPALAKLSQLDSTRCPGGRLLLAEVAGELHAALPIDGAQAIADPFRHTDDLIRLLEMRRAQTPGDPGRARGTWLALIDGARHTAIISPRRQRRGSALGTDRPKIGSSSAKSRESSRCGQGGAHLRSTDQRQERVGACRTRTASRPEARSHSQSRAGRKNMRNEIQKRSAGPLRPPDAPARNFQVQGSTPRASPICRLIGRRRGRDL